MRLLDYTVGNDFPLFIIAGPCVIESEQLVIETVFDESVQGLDVGLVVGKEYSLQRNRAH